MDDAGGRPEVALDVEIGLAEAEIAAGQAGEAIARLQALIEAPVYDPRLHYAMAAALGAAGDLEGARAALADAQTFHALQLIRDAGADLDRLTSDPAYAVQLGHMFYARKLMGPAAAAFSQAVTRPEPTAQAVVSWGLSLQHQGRIEEALTAFRFAAAQFPQSAVHELLLYACFFAEDGVQLHAAEVRRWAERYAPPYDPRARIFPNPSPAGRRLRVGYVAPSFMGSQLRQFILPVLEHHDPDRVEVVLYAADSGAEAGAPASLVRSIAALDDHQVASRVVEDRIDVLVDLWGHTAGGRLGVFALKPAPVQAAWINYVQSTGLEAMDYVLHADGTAAPGDQELFTETIWRLGPVAAPFRPGRRLDPTPTPALSEGVVTFASFNHPSRLNDATIAAWARILKGRPNSRLLLKYAYFDDPVLQSATLSRFAAHGVGSARILFEGHSTGEAYLAAFGRIDLALDPSPCPGGTTSSEAVANGVPLLTLRGPDFYSRVGTLRLEPLGLHQLVAEDWDDYVDRALALTADLEALQALRASVRPRFDASAIRDEAGFTRRLEDAFAQMYQHWFDARG